MILLDTNILVRLADRNDPQYQTTHGAIRGCFARKRELIVSHQSLHEFWAVTTRPASKNGLGMQTTAADRYINRFIRLFNLVDDPPGLFSQWRDLVNRLNVQGLQSYDARLAAFAIATKCRGIMTYNLADFAQFPIPVVDPNNPSTL
ncbi:MAG: type II toxin-antitoxin system VapC family toxin [Phycisphaerae bacterium]